MTLTVGGLTSIHQSPSGSSNSNYDTPTNPKITKNTAFSNRVFGIIHTDDTLLGSNANTVIEKVGTALLTPYSNLENTNGHTIRCYDGTNGVDLSSIDLTTDTYFVLIHSDNANMHHFAKIKTVENADSNGDSFTFEPKLGDRIAKNTEFMIFKGPSIANSSKIIAITGGLDASVFGANYVVSRPLWYFYNDKTVKDNELDHNTKYFVRLHEASSGNSIDLSASAEKVSFVTMAETHYRIIDSSKYSYVVKLKDNLKVKDDPDTATSNESSVLTGTFTNYTDYNDCFINARRDSDDVYTSLSLNGPTRYTHYRDSPEKSNLVNNVFDSYIEESIDGKAGYSETKIIDNNQILGKKLETNQDYVIRQAIGTGNFNDWVEVGEIDAFVSVFGGTQYFYSLKNPTFGEQINISRYFNQNDEIKIGERICIVENRSGTTQIVLNNFSRLETEGTFTTTFNMHSLTSGTKVYRRAFNKNESNLLTPITFEEANLKRLRVVLYSDSAKAIEATVTDFPTASPTVDETYGLLFLDFPENHHDDDDNGLEYVEGEYVILYEVFTGKVEKITKKIENGNNIVTIGGRNTFNKLVNPIINRDSLYSLDAIYSSSSPYQSITSIGTTVATTSLQSKAVTFGANVTLSAGTHIFGDLGFIGKLDGIVSSSTSGTLEDYPLIHYSGTGYTGTRQFMFNKAMSSNPEISSSTDLSGAANKGMSFRDGTQISASSGAEVSDLAGTSSNSDARAIGYTIDQTDSVGTKDSLFLAKNSHFGNEVVNTLLDFNILEIRQESTNKVIKLAPHIPITLGRGNINFNNESELTLVTIGTTIGSSTTNGGKIEGSFTSFSLPYHTPIYIDGVYQGRFTIQNIQPPTSGSNSFIRTTVEQPNIGGWSAGKSIQIASSKIQHELLLINGAHLHGGKTIGLLGTDNNIIEFEPFDTSSHISYSNKFGNSIFRIFNLEKGLIGPSHGKNSFGKTLVSGLANVRLRPNGIFNYYATSYKGRNTVKYNIGNSNVYDSRVMPIERRGLRPVTYSNYYGRILPNSASLGISKDYRVLNDLALNSGYAEALEVEDTLYHPSPNAARLFLFANCDIHPYSSTRKDSLMNSATRNIEKYGLLSFGNLLEYESGEDKESVTGDSRRVSHLDSSYSHNSIIESTKTLSGLKRFGLMRLTELVTDYAYNPINPEEDIDVTKYHRRLDDVLNYDVDMVINSGGTGVLISAISDYGTFTGRNSTVTLTSTPTNLATGDLLVDLINNVIWGKVNSTPTGASVSIEVNHLSENGALYAGTLYRISKSESDTVYAQLSGKEINSVIYETGAYESGIHPNKNMFFASARVFCDDNTGSSLNPNNKFFDKYGEKLLTIARSGEAYGMISPFVFSENNVRTFLIDRHSQTCSTNGTTTLTVQDSSILEVGAYFNGGAEETNFGIAAGVYITAITGPTSVTLSSAASATHSGSLSITTKRPKKTFHLSRIFKQLDYANLPTVDYTNYGLANMSRHKVVLLKGYSVESGRDIEAGEVHGLGGLSLEILADGSDRLVVPIYDDCRYSILGDVSGSNDFTSLAGAYSGYKFEFRGGETGTSAVQGIGLSAGLNYPVTKKAAGNKTYYQFKFSHKGKYNFLQFLDLTGCYLVAVLGFDTNEVSINATNSFSKDVHVGNSGTQEAIAYVVSHVYDTSTSITDDEDFSYITLDLDLSHSDFNLVRFKIMQPNPVCFWNNSPKEIHINHLSAKYTKKASSSELYGQIKNYENKESGHSEDNAGNSVLDSNEGVLSMYSIIDLDNIGQNNKTVLRTRNAIKNVINGINTEMCVSDGETNVVGNIGGSLSTNERKHTLVFENLKYLQGAVSVSETFELKTNGDIKNTDKRAIIGATLDISREVEGLVEDLFIENDVTHSLVSSNYDIYASPDFQGSSLYSLAKYLLNLKDKTLFDNAGTITSRDILDSNSITRYEFNDDNIIEYELVDSGFDFYNEIIVYGGSHKAVKKNIRSIKSIGKKTLETFDKKLKSQSDVDKRAFELLDIHNNDTGNLEIKTHIRSAETVSSGDIVIVEIKQENIPRNLYMVLEMKYEISGLTTLILGKYKKGIEDRFSELLLSNKQTDSYLRKKDFPENDLTFDFFENIKIKEINLVLRKRTQTGITLGFSHTLNTDTSTIGFGGGTITHTTLLEEDL